MHMELHVRALADSLYASLAKHCASLTKHCAGARSRRDNLGQEAHMTLHFYRTNKIMKLQ